MQSKGHPLDVLPGPPRKAFIKATRAGRRAADLCGNLKDSTRSLEVRLRMHNSSPLSPSGGDGVCGLDASKTGVSVAALRRADDDVFQDDEGHHHMTHTLDKDHQFRQVARRLGGGPDGGSQSSHPNGTWDIFLRKRRTRNGKALDMEEMELLYEMKLIRRTRFCEHLTMVVSVMYAMALCCLGPYCYFADIFFFKGELIDFEMSDMFNIFVCSMGSVFLIWFQLDIHFYVKFIKDYWKLHGRNGQNKEGQSIPNSNGGMRLVKNQRGFVELDLPASNGQSDIVINKYHLFSTERHSGSTFLKLGAVFFCLGHLVHLSLMIVEFGSFYGFDDEWTRTACIDNLSFASLVLQFVFSCLMLLVIFRYGNIIVNRYAYLVRFGFMHCIGASLTFWVYHIVMETNVTLVAKYVHNFQPHGDLNQRHHHHHHHQRSWGRAFNLTSPVLNQSSSKEELGCYNTSIMTHECFIAKWANCSMSNSIAHSISHILPYAYPFSIEFSILIVGIWFIMWENVGSTERQLATQTKFVPGHVSRERSVSGDPQVQKAVFTKHDLQTSGKGIVGGIGFLVLALFGILANFILQSSEEPYRQSLSFYLSDSIHTFMLFIMTLASLKLYTIISELEVNPNPVQFLDDLLLFICIPSHIVLAICTVAPSVYFILTGRYLESIGQVFVYFLIVVQVTVQTPMLVDGLRRCSENPAVRKAKPGRNLISFLLAANLVMYIWDNLQAKATSIKDAPTAFFQPFFWKIINHACLPLVLFYRFHSAVVLADIWTTAYEGGDHEDHQNVDYERVRVNIWPHN